MECDQPCGKDIDSLCPAAYTRHMGFDDVFAYVMLVAIGAWWVFSWIFNCWEDRRRRAQFQEQHLHSQNPHESHGEAIAGIVDGFGLTGGFD